MKSVGKLNGKTHFEDRDGVYEMGREDAQFLELTHVPYAATANQLRASSKIYFLKKYFIRIYK
jgi:hypothetical protein